MPVCRTNLYNKIVQLEVCRTFSGRGMGINGTAQIIILVTIIRTVYMCMFVFIITIIIIIIISSSSSSNSSSSSSSSSSSIIYRYVIS